MRLRQLATTQSVVFFAPPEVDQSIKDVCNLPRNAYIDSAHVITWLLEMTCRANEQLTNLHLAQGVDYCRRMNGQWSNPKFLNDEGHRKKLLNVIQQPERQSLEQQYGLITDVSTRGSADEVAYAELQGFMSKLTVQRRAMAQKANGHGMHSSALEEVEQQREVEIEIEEVRNVQRPRRYEALKFSKLHPAINNFVRTGRLAGNDGYVHAFDSLQNTSIGQKYEVHGTGSRFFVSQQFTRTVVLRKEKADNVLVSCSPPAPLKPRTRLLLGYTIATALNKTGNNPVYMESTGWLTKCGQRPVEWILWSPTTETALLIIPEEAELVIPLIRRSGQTSRVHLITYAAPVTKVMLKNFDNLRYYNLPDLPRDYRVPAWFSIELGIFAGQLYITHEECSLVAQYLQRPVAHGGADGDDPGVGVGRAFAQNPMAFLSEWLPLRRQLSDVMQTPMGYIIQGRTHALHPEHAFFVTRVAESPNIVDMPVSTGSSDDTSDEDEDDFSDIGGGVEESWDDLGEEDTGKTADEKADEKGV